MVNSVFLVYMHVSTGTVALLAGAAALLLRKGSPGHRAAGQAFVPAMLVMSATGTYMMIFRPEMLSVAVGALTFYLVATAWVTVRRRPGESGAFEVGAMLLALGIGAFAWHFGLEAARSETGLKDGYPAAAYFFSGSVALVAAALDAKLILRGGVTGKARLLRHLWRMGAGMFVATASLFLGQPQLFSEPVRRSGALFVPVLLVIVITLFWLLLIALSGCHRRWSLARPAAPSLTTRCQ